MNLQVGSSLAFRKNPITVDPSWKPDETGLRPNSDDGIPCILLLRIEAIGFPTIGLLL